MFVFVHYTNANDTGKIIKHFPDFLVNPRDHVAFI